MNRPTVLITSIAPAVWGTTYWVTAELLPPGRPLLAATLRALPVGLLLVAIGRRAPHGIWWIRSAVLGVLNFGLFFALLFAAAYRLPGGVAATIGASQPLIVTVLTVVVLAERARPARIVAAAIGVAGVAALVLQPGARLDPIGVVCALGGAASMATGTVLVQRWGRPVSAPTFAGWQLTAGGVLLAPIALLTEGLPSALTVENATGYLYLMGIGAGLAYPLWFRGIGRLGASAATFLSLLSPLVATTIGLGISGERMTSMQAVGAAAVVLSIVAGNRAAAATPSTIAPAAPSAIAA